MTKFRHLPAAGRLIIVVVPSGCSPSPWSPAHPATTPLPPRRRPRPVRLPHQPALPPRSTPPSWSPSWPPSWAASCGPSPAPTRCRPAGRARPCCCAGLGTIYFNVAHAYLIGGRGDPLTVWRCVVASLPPLLMMLSAPGACAIVKSLMLAPGPAPNRAAALTPTATAPRRLARAPRPDGLFPPHPALRASAQRNPFRKPPEPSARTGGGEQGPGRGAQAPPGRGLPVRLERPAARPTHRPRDRRHPQGPGPGGVGAVRGPAPRCVERPAEAAPAGRAAGARPRSGWTSVTSATPVSWWPPWSTPGYHEAAIPRSPRPCWWSPRAGRSALKWGHRRGDWQQAGDHHPEVLVGGEGLARGAREVQPPCCTRPGHGLADARRSRDTSRSGRYHNRRYGALARAGPGGGPGRGDPLVGDHPAEATATAYPGCRAEDRLVLAPPGVAARRPAATCWSVSVAAARPRPAAARHVPPATCRSPRVGLKRQGADEPMDPDTASQAGRPTGACPARLGPGDLLAALGELGCARAAQVYAALGFPVVPMHTAQPGGGCSCADRACPDPGKHPRLRGWKRLAADRPGGGGGVVAALARRQPGPGHRPAVRRARPGRRPGGGGAARRLVDRPDRASGAGGAHRRGRLAPAVSPRPGWATGSGSCPGWTGGAGAG